MANRNTTGFGLIAQGVRWVQHQPLAVKVSTTSRLTMLRHYFKALL